ncbi:MAG: hypothetical protein V3T31_08295, partial [candidate division Zixibacteria bacterium]
MKKSGDLIGGGFLDSALFKITSKLMLGTLVAVLFLTVVQCTVNKPEAPSWTTSLTVPVVNRTWTMAEIVDKIDQDGLEIIGDSVVYTFSDSLDPFGLDAADLTTADFSDTITQQLGTFDLAPASLAPDTVNFAAQFGWAAAQIPGVTIGVPTITTPIVSSCDSAVVNSGQLRVTITNQLGLDLEEVDISLRNIGGAFIATQSLGDTLVNGASDVIAFDLAGKAIQNQFEVTATVTTITGFPAVTPELITSVQFANLSVDWAIAEVPAITPIDFSQRVELAGESDTIYHASLTAGQLALNIENNTAIPCTLSIDIPNISNGGTPLSIIRTVAANS